jgi:hypothetical protein
MANDPFDDPFYRFSKQQGEARHRYSARRMFQWQRELSSVKEMVDKLGTVDDKLRGSILEGFGAIDDLLGNINERIDELSGEGLNETEKRLVNIRIQLGKLSQAAQDLRGRKGEDFIKLSKLLDRQISHAGILEKQAQVIEIERKMEQMHRDAMQPIEDMRKKFHDMWNTGKMMVSSLMGVRVALAATISLFLQQTLKAFDTLREQGTTLGGSFRGTGRSIGDSIKQLLQGRVVGFQRSAETRAGLAGLLGGGPNNNILDVASRLQNTFLLGTEESTQIAEQIYRMSGYSSTFAQDMLTAAKGAETLTQIPAGKLIKEMAADANIFAQYMGKVPQAIYAAYIRSWQLGISLQSADQFANRLTDDFESSISLQAELQTLFPGFDLSEAQYAAQFGSTDQVLSAVSQQIRNLGVSNISQLPRSLRNRLASSLGLSEADLQRALQGESAGIVTQSQIGSVQGTQESRFENLMYSLTNFISGTDIARNSLIALAAAAVAASTGLLGGILGKAGKLFGMGGLSGIGGAALGFGGRLLKGGAIGAATYAGGNILGNVIGGRTGDYLKSISTGAGLGATIGSVVPVVGTGIGALAGGGLGALYEFIKGTDAQSEMPIPNRSQIQMFPSDNTTKSGLQLDTSRLEQKLDTLITSIKTMGVEVNLDGKKVGDGIVTAMSRR